VGCVLALGVLLGCPSDTPKAAGGALDGSVPSVARARLRDMKGTINVKRAAGDDWTVAREGMELFENDKIRTSSGASVVVETDSGSLALGEDSLLGIPEVVGNIILLEGRVDGRLADQSRRLVIETPAAKVKAGREIFFQ
jgi:hypothetical protein